MNSNYKNDIDIFFTKLSFRLDEYEKVKKQLNIYLSKDFNVFDYIKPSENMLSNIIADLLNVKGKHGQGEKFLSLFLEIIPLEDISDFNLVNSRIECESFTSHIENNRRRIDITIDFMGNYGIGIENKPWYRDRDEQISDYMNHMKKKYSGNYKIIYLSGDRTPPNENSVDINSEEYKDNVLVISYKNEIIKWLNACYKENESEKFRWFLKDFINYVNQSFNDLEYI